ncbi:heavy-metal-associated domain-containing protein [Marinobacterium mangrovicola]|uniref:Cation transporter n=1 Tax=Marinobacterium mangrovicola TaxID=1476959 RepID=A0A4R1G781_9GAMM|nr:heavy-metal-associated domain-containing protein [Marinobacterium mangrovicola]TCK02345.1 hypothetical protein CLV83_4530 [Marinobacterium mangrovicola]
MSHTEHKPGVREAFLVQRHLLLESLDAGKAAAIAEEIEPLRGVDSVRLDPDSQRLDIAYDASVLQLDQIEAIVRSHGSDLDQGWWTRFKEGWYRYTDQNIKDNAKHEPFCCSKVPPRK